MFGILLKNNLRGMLRRFTYDTRSGKPRSKAGVVGMGILIGFAFLSLAFSFVMMFVGLGAALLISGHTDLYFASAGVLAAVMGLTGGAFTAYSALFGAKDNEMLLAMPVKPSSIILSRVFSVYIMLVLWSGLVFIPALSVFSVMSGLDVPAMLRGIAVYLALTLLLLAVACLLGWLIALLATRINSKKLITVLSLLMVAAIYYFFYFQRDKVVTFMTDNPDAATEKLKGFAPAYWLGSGVAGNIGHFLLFVGISVVAGGLTYLLIAKSFIAMVTARKGRRKKAYVEKALKVSGVGRTLLKREMRMFFSSPMYVVNGGLGSLIMLGLAVAAIIKGQALNGLLERVTGELGEGLSVRVLAAIVAAIPLLAGTLLSMNQITSLSISFEGSRLWIIQTLPVEARKVFRAKVLVNLLVTGIPAVFLTAAVMAVLRANPLSVIFGVLYVAALTVVISGLGLLVDMRWPMLDWTDENMVIKKVSGGLPILIGWGIGLVAGGLMIGLSFLLPGPVPIILGSLIVAAGAFFVVRGLSSQRTAEKFYTL